jgi:hypothetical protein
MPASGARCIWHTRFSGFGNPPSQGRRTAEKQAALNAAVVQAVTAVLEGLENPVFIAEADPMAPGDACAEAMRRPETPFHDRQ